MPVSLHRLDSIASLTDCVARRVAEAIGSSARAGPVSVVVTGGSTPRAYYPPIARLELPWDRVWITLSDERWVAADDAESNERLVRETLLRDRARTAHFVPLKNDAETAAAGLLRTAAALRAIVHPYALVVLGVGADSHIASLFPGADGLDAALADDAPLACAALAPPPGVLPALPRVTMTLRELLDSQRIVLAARGADKLQVIEQALAGRWPARTPLYELALRAHQPVDLYWCP